MAVYDRELVAARLRAPHVCEIGTVGCIHDQCSEKRASRRRYDVPARMVKADPTRHGADSSRQAQSLNSSLAAKRRPQTANAKTKHIGLARLRKKASKVPR